MTDVIIKRTAAAAALFLSICCCERIPIYDTVSNYKIEFFLSEHEILYNKPDSVQAFAVTVMDTMKFERKSYITLGRQGGYFPMTIVPDEYFVFVHNLEVQSTIVNETESFKRTHFTTRQIERNDALVVYSEPTHVFQNYSRMNLPVVMEGQEYVYTDTLHSVCDSWRVIVSGIKGAENVLSAGMYVSNQCTVFIPYEGVPSGCGVIHHEMYYDMLGWDGTVVTTDFCTFGMPEADLPVKLQFNFMDENGDVYSEIFDVTDQVRNPSNTSHVINVFYDVTLSKNYDGGLKPSANEWDDKIYIYDLE